MIERITKIINSCINRNQIFITMRYMELARKQKMINESEVYSLVQKMMEKVESFEHI